MVAVLQTSDIDLWSDEVLLDPYPAFAELREQAAVVRLEKNGVWALTRYDAIRDALGELARFLVERGRLQRRDERRTRRHHPRHRSAASTPPCEPPSPRTSPPGRCAG